MSRKVAHNALWNVAGTLASLLVGLVALPDSGSTLWHSHYHASASAHIAAARSTLKSTHHEQ